MEQPLDSAGVCHVSRGTCRDQHCCSGDTGNGRVGGRGDGEAQWIDVMIATLKIAISRPGSLAASARQRRPPLAGGWELRGERGNIRPRSYSLILSLLYSLHVWTRNVNLIQSLATNQYWEVFHSCIIYFIVRRFLIREALKGLLDWSHSYKISRYIWL